MRYDRRGHLTHHDGIDRIVDFKGRSLYGRRFYQRELGRWLSPDPAGFTDGMNLYAFVHNNPLTYFDEYGLLDFGQWQNPTQYQRDSRQFAIGVNHGLINAAYGTAHFINSALYHSFNSLFDIGAFSDVHKRSYQAIDRWLNQHQSSINQRWFSRGGFFTPSKR